MTLFETELAFIKFEHLKFIKWYLSQGKLILMVKMMSFQEEIRLFNYKNKIF